MTTSLELLQKAALAGCEPLSQASSLSSYALPSQSQASAESDEQKPPPQQRGKKRGRFEDLKSNKQRKERYNDIYEAILAWAEENGVDLSHILGEIGARYYYNRDKKKAEMFRSIREGSDPVSPKKVDTPMALYLQDYLEIGRRRYVNLAGAAVVSTSSLWTDVIFWSVPAP